MRDDESASSPLGSAIAEQDPFMEPGHGDIEALMFDGPMPDGYGLRHPIQIHVWTEAGEYVADAPELNVHSFGADRGAAIGHLTQLIVSHYERLERHGDKLSQLMTEDRERLRNALVAPDA